MIRAVFGGLLLCAGLGFAQIAPLPAEVLQLSRAKRMAAANLKNLPDYTCLATCRRYEKKAGNSGYQKIDTIELEVAFIGTREFFSAPGERSFSEQRVNEIVQGGMIGDGDFAVNAQNLFVKDAGTQTWYGPDEWKGRKALRWDYHVPLLISGWTIKVPGLEQTVGEEGSFWVDADSLELIAIETRATDLLPGSSVVSIRSVVEYARAAIGGQSVLLPKSAELTMTERSGRISRNETQYGNCRQYTGQSMISFGH